MRVIVLSVGRPRDAALSSLHDRYAQRIGKLGILYLARHVPEVRAGGRFSDRHVREREARALRRSLDGKGSLVALDPGGGQLRSEELARRLERWASPQVTFIVGGPLGLDPGLVESCDVRWSLTLLTLPHELVRVVLAEQIYRAATILRGLPYHK